MKKLTHGMHFPMDEDELFLLRQLSEVQNTGPTNLIRRLLRKAASDSGLEVQEQFLDRTQGNKLPKKRKVENDN